MLISMWQEQTPAKSHHMESTAIGFHSGRFLLRLVGVCERYNLCRCAVSLKDRQERRGIGRQRVESNFLTPRNHLGFLRWSCVELTLICALSSALDLRRPLFALRTAMDSQLRSFGLPTALAISTRSRAVAVPFAVVLELCLLLSTGSRRSNGKRCLRCPEVSSSTCK